MPARGRFPRTLKHTGAAFREQARPAPPRARMMPNLQKNKPHAESAESAEFSRAVLLCSSAPAPDSHPPMAWRAGRRGTSRRGPSGTGEGWKRGRGPSAFWGFIADVVADHAEGSSRGKARRRAVASSRNGEYRGIFRKHLSRRVPAAPCRRLHLPRVFPGACLAVEPGGSAGASAARGRRPPPFVRSGSSRDRAAGIVTAGSQVAPAALVSLPRKTRMAPCHTPPLCQLSASPAPGTVPA
jgi:hypothetical protein